MLSEGVENDLTETIKIAGEWGFPLTKNNIQSLVRYHMESQNIAKIKPNSPGKDWCYGYIKRSKDVLSVRQSQNIKRSRAKVCPETINSYFDKLTETNFVDDPKSKKAVIRKGENHADKLWTTRKALFQLCLLLPRTVSFFHLILSMLPFTSTAHGPKEGQRVPDITVPNPAGLIKLFSRTGLLLWRCPIS
ncbi:uncharacterized protein LOC129722145 isoform X1 [Wyeomyia smithii]|uniref:uncharacterized protein LOC129722145 isoform X1 n=1 Tax=Wyeomyia smithii TaxID=174621 RepID=UPI0024681039|nr:uncharacterized protein LOC129722145 isoform X1 [Wyeomyia smithii]